MARTKTPTTKSVLSFPGRSWGDGPSFSGEVGVSRVIDLWRVNVRGMFRKWFPLVARIVLDLVGLAMMLGGVRGAGV